MFTNVKAQFTNVNRGRAGAGCSDARAANVPCAPATWSNADEGSERKAAGAQGASPPLRTAPCTCPAYCLLDNELLSARQIIGNVNHLLFPVVNHLVYFNITALHHFLNKVVKFTYFSS